MDDIRPGSRIRFLHTLEEGPTENYPAVVYAYKGEIGTVTSIGDCWEGFWVKTDSYSIPFGCEQKDFEVIKEEKE